MDVGVLGTGQNKAFIASRDGRALLLEVPHNKITWGRALNGVSTATVSVSPAKCTPQLEDAEPWAHNLVVFRNKTRVWEGPLWDRDDDSPDGLSIVAHDPIGWMERRAVAVARNSIGGLVRDQMVWAVQQAFAADNPNVLAYLQTLGPATETADLTVAVAEKYQADVLSDMGGNGGRYTALGRSIILWDEAHNLGTLRDLSPENHLLSDVALGKDGTAFATRVRARNDNGVVGTATPTGAAAVDPRYGLVELIVPSGAGSTSGVTRTAQAAANKSFPIPLTITVPPSAALRCDAPFPIQSLVPGMLVPVQTTTATSVTVRGTFMLTALDVSQEAGKDETVAITLAPVSEALA